MSNIEPLPGLLDNPLFDVPDLPSRTDFQIAPLRNPAPTKHGNAPPRPLEPVTESIEARRPTNPNHAVEEDLPTSPPRIRPRDFLLAREAKKPHLAISELVDSVNDVQEDEIDTLQLPSFVSLAAVEKSPVPNPSVIHPYKRPRLEATRQTSQPDVHRVLPRPAKKDGNGSNAREVRLLPVMVNGLHDPPASTGLLPSMDPDTQPKATRSMPSKMAVRDILAETKRARNRVGPETMLNSPAPSTAQIRKSVTENESFPLDNAKESMLDYNTNTPLEGVMQSENQSSAREISSADQKSVKSHRRQRRPWSSHETANLMNGVLKHGPSKWTAILHDPDYKFNDRMAVDLKDRYRVFSKDDPNYQPPEALLHAQSDEESSSRNTTAKLESEKTKPTRKKNEPWTSVEDDELLRGVQIHGFKWTDIVNDSQIDLGHRRATDLRDRIRRLLPDLYKNAESRPAKKSAQNSRKLEPGGSSTNGTTAASRNGPRSKPKSSTSNISTTKSNAASVSKDSATSPAAASVSKFSKSNQPESQVSNSAPGQPSNMLVAPATDHGDITLPSLNLEDEGLDWDDTTLPPLLPWDDLGI